MSAIPSLSLPKDRYQWLDELYRQAPDLLCRRQCAQSCVTGPIRIGAAEYERIAERVGYRPHGNPAARTCPLLVDGLCTVHDIRPMICRLWGAAVGMRCKHGCQPDRWLTNAEVDALLNQVYSRGISYELWGEAAYHEGKKRMELKTIIKNKIEEYRIAFEAARDTANANHGAMQAMQDVLAQIEADEKKAAESQTIPNNPTK